MPRLPAPLPHPPKRAAAHYGPARDSVSQPSHIHSMEEGKEGRPIREEEARYLVIQIAMEADAIADKAAPGSRIEGGYRILAEGYRSPARVATRLHKRQTGERSRY
jgi:hypothetical protein